MQVRFFATIREITREKEIRWDGPALELDGLLHGLSARYGVEFAKWCWDGRELGKAIIILVNGRDVRHLGGLDTRLDPDDVVSVFPMIAGGSTGRQV